MSIIRLVLFLLCCWVTPLAWSQDAQGWLQRMSQAARNLNYSGVFVYQSGGRSESSRISHWTDASGEHERLEALDGTPREVLRNNEEVQSFFPASKLVVIDRAAKERFPRALASKGSALADYYNIRLGGIVRVVARDAQLVYLEPRDDMRYGHQFWADLETGLLLTARMQGEGGQVVEQFAFTEIMLGVLPERERLKPRNFGAGEWKVVDARGSELRIEDLPWNLKALPMGYRPVALSQRVMRKEGPEVLHLVLSDGLASISVFIEPLSRTKGVNLDQKPAGTGATGIFRRVVGEHLVTVIGEAPLLAIRRVAEALEARNK